MRVGVVVRPERKRITGISATVSRDTVKDPEHASIGFTKLTSFTPETR
jgi:hypothetical protein